MAKSGVGQFVAIGVGPGDPELLTLKAARLLKAADVVLAPVGERSDRSLAAEIVASLLDTKRQQLLHLSCPMRSDEADRAERWAQIAADIAVMVRNKKSVAFVTLGDPMFYSTFLYLYRELQNRYPDVPIAIVPGISSVYAAASLAGIPLGLVDETFSVVPATASDVEIETALSRRCGTVVLLKVYRAFERLRQLLRRLDLEQNAVYVRRIGLEGEKVMHDLSQVTADDLDYMSLILVRQKGTENV
jgi:precorrin-2/cobalt-factor-2 C20-methyltransferase